MTTVRRARATHFPLFSFSLSLNPPPLSVSLSRAGGRARRHTHVCTWEGGVSAARTDRARYLNVVVERPFSQFSVIPPHRSAANRGARTAAENARTHHVHGARSRAIHTRHNGIPVRFCLIKGERHECRGDDGRTHVHDTVTHEKAALARRRRPDALRAPAGPPEASAALRRRARCQGGNYESSREMGARRERDRAKRSVEKSPITVSLNDSASTRTRLG